MDHFSTFYQAFNSSFTTYVNEFVEKYAMPNDFKPILTSCLVNPKGKYFRPFLIHLMADHYHINQEISFGWGLSVELIHTYSLIHDDLPSMDNATVRRGRPSCWKEFGEANAILVGDGLQALAFEVLSYIPLQDTILIKLMRLLATMSGLQGMVLGQFMDINPLPLNKEKNNQSFCNEQQKHDFQEKLVYLKTGSLINACIQGPLFCCRATKKECDDWANFAHNLSLLFQYRDDYLDYCGNDKILGKPTGLDHGKITLMSSSSFHLDRLDRLHALIQNHLKNYGCDNALFKGMITWIMERQS